MVNYDNKPTDRRHLLALVGNSPKGVKLTSSLWRKNLVIVPACSAMAAKHPTFFYIGVPKLSFQDAAFLPSTFLIIVVEVTTSGLPQVLKLWFRVRKDMLPVQHLAPKILMAVNYCGYQPAQILGQAVPAFRRKEGATLCSGSCKHSLQYIGRPH